MGQDLQRILEVDHRIEAVTGGVLDPVLVTDARGQGSVGSCGGAEPRQFTQQVGMADPEAGDAGFVLGIEQAAIGQQEAHSDQRLVTVLRGAAAHARGVVGGNTADLAGIDRGRIGADLALEWRQPGVHFAAYHRRPHSHSGRIRSDLAAGKALADQDQQTVSHRLTRQAGAGGAKGHPATMGKCDL